MRGARVYQTGILIGSGQLETVSLMREGDLPRYLSLEAEVGGFFIPYSKSGGHRIHCLDVMHYPGGESCREVGNQGGGVF